MNFNIDSILAILFVVNDAIHFRYNVDDDNRLVEQVFTNISHLLKKPPHSQRFQHKNPISVKPTRGMR